MVKLINIFMPSEDTFYSTLRPLAPVSKALGMFPLQNTLASEGRDLAYHWLSIATLWGPVLYYSAHTVFYFLETNKWWRFLVLYLNVPRTISISVASFIEDRHLTELITSIEEFDEKYKRISRKYVDSSWRTYLGVVWMFVSVACTVFHVTSEMYFTHPADSFESHVVSVTNQANTLPHSLYLIMFMFFCQSLVWRFQDVRTLWRETVRGIEAEQFFGQKARAEKRLEDVRLLYHELAITVKVLNTCYGLRLTVFFFNLVTLILESIYFVLYVETTSENTVEIIYIAFAFSTLGIVTHFAGKLADTANGIRDELGGCRVTLLPLECRQQVQLFATCRSEVHVSASGFCDVDRSLMVSVFVSISTYMIVIVQFAPQLGELTSGFVE